MLLRLISGIKKKTHLVKGKRQQNTCKADNKKIKKE